MAAPSPFLRLSLDGTIFETTRGTLGRVPSTYFTGMLAWAPPPDGVYRIDKSPRPFALILEYMREGLGDMLWCDADLADESLLAAVGRDAAYFCLQELAHFCAKLALLRRVFQSAHALPHLVEIWLANEGQGGTGSPFVIPPPSPGFATPPGWAKVRCLFDQAHKHFCAFPDAWLASPKESEYEKFCLYVSRGAPFTRRGAIAKLLAMRNSPLTEKILFLASFGCDVNDVDANGNTFLHIFIRNCSSNRLRVLDLQRIPGIDLGRRNALGESIFYVACTSWSDSPIAKARYLLSAGVDDINSRDSKGKSVVQFLTEAISAPDSAARKTLFRELLDFLVSRGAVP
jgi:hypothetical protein